MHAVLIRFKPTFAIESMKAQIAALATELCTVEGLVMKTWITQGPVVGGFHVFATREAADRFVDGPHIEGIMDDDRFTDIDVRHYDILDEPSAINGTPREPLAKKAAA